MLHHSQKMQVPDEQANHTKSDGDRNVPLFRKREYLQTPLLGFS